MYTIAGAAQLLGVTTLTLRRWDKSGKLVPSIRTPDGHRRYTLEDLSSIKPIQVPEKRIIAYCRVSTSSLRRELKSQSQRVSTYCAAKGYAFTMLYDTGNGLNFSRPGFKELLHLILSDQVEKVIVEHRDLLAGAGFEIFEQICKFHDVSIEIMDQTPYAWYQEEIADNMLSMLIELNEKLKGSKYHQSKKSMQNIKKMFVT